MCYSNYCGTFQLRRFCVLLCIALFLLLSALRLDDHIAWSVWHIFVPLWLWKVISLSDSLMNLSPYLSSRMHNNLKKEHIVLSLLNFLFLLALLLFEVLLAHRFGNSSPCWIITFSPLLFSCIISALKCFWAVKFEHPLDVELFFAMNTVSFLLIALRLDSFINWSWIVVFIPVWVLLSILTLMVTFGILSSMMACDIQKFAPEDRKFIQYAPTLYGIVLIGLITFCKLFIDKFDGNVPIPYVTMTIPLWISLSTLTWITTRGKKSEMSWFGFEDSMCIWVQRNPSVPAHGSTTSAVHVTDNHKSQVFSGNQTLESSRTLCIPVHNDLNAGVNSLLLVCGSSGLNQL